MTGFTYGAYQMITDRSVDQAYSDLKSTCDGRREDYFGLLYLEREHRVPRERAINAFEKCMKVAYQKWNWVHKKLGLAHKTPLTSD
jgi:hypothetical protein